MSNSSCIGYSQRFSSSGSNCALVWVNKTAADSIARLCIWLYDCRDVLHFLGQSWEDVSCWPRAKLTSANRTLDVFKPRDCGRGHHDSSAEICVKGGEEQ